jgi:hypothetical protein
MTATYATGVPLPEPQGGVVGNSGSSVVAALYDEVDLDVTDPPGIGPLATELLGPLGYCYGPEGQAADYLLSRDPEGWHLSLRPSLGPEGLSWAIARGLALWAKAEGKLGAVSGTHVAQVRRRRSDAEGPTACGYYARCRVEIGALRPGEDDELEELAAQLLVPEEALQGLLGEGLRPEEIAAHFVCDVWIVRQRLGARWPRESGCFPRFAG